VVLEARHVLGGAWRSVVLGSLRYGCWAKGGRPEALIPPQLAGLGASLVGMVAGSLLEARQKGGQSLQPVS